MCLFIPILVPKRICKGNTRMTRIEGEEGIREKGK
jgi:hypothetical protein